MNWIRSECSAQNIITMSNGKWNEHGYLCGFDNGVSQGMGIGPRLLCDLGIPTSGYRTLKTDYRRLLV